MHAAITFLLLIVHAAITTLLLLIKMTNANYLAEWRWTCIQSTRGSTKIFLDKDVPKEHINIRKDVPKEHECEHMGLMQGCSQLECSPRVFGHAVGMFPKSLWVCDGDVSTFQIEIFSKNVGGDVLDGNVPKEYIGVQQDDLKCRYSQSVWVCG